MTDAITLTIGAMSIAWAEQLTIWIIAAPVAVAVLALIHLCCRTEPDAWPIHHPKDRR